MFDSPAAARQALRGYFDEGQAEQVIGALVPAVMFEPAPDGGSVPGGTRLGGTPDSGPGAEWPRPPAPADIEEIARRGNADAAAHMRRHLGLALPYLFVGQIDLAEAALLGSAASDLPSEGRLLVFYDLAVGPWETGARVARVIWDRSPRESLASPTPPPGLAEAAQRERDELAALWAKHFPRETVERQGTNYDAPARAMRLKLALRLPRPGSLEIEALPELDAIHRGQAADEEAEAFRDAYDAALEAFDDPYATPAWRHQLLGSPIPEQDDPRYNAVVASEFGVQHLSSDEWQERRQEVFARARDWRLLLQVALSDLLQDDLTEGTVYLLIRHRDLAERRFDRVVAVYQQT